MNSLKDLGEIMRYTSNFRETTISRLLFIAVTISAAANLFLTSLGVAVAYAADTETTSVGDNLTASWDPTAKILTVSGHGQLDRAKWMSETPATTMSPIVDSAELLKMQMATPSQPNRSRWKYNLFLIRAPP